MPARTSIAIGLTRRRLFAIAGSGDEGALRIRRVLSVERPADIGNDPPVLGAWLAAELRRARFPHGPVTVALPREQFGLKRITLPTDDPGDLPEMTRLAMQRELTFPAADAVIDFLPVHEKPAQTTVIAAAVPREVLEQTQRVLRAAGFRPGRLSLRALGVAALAGSYGSDPSASTLAIDVTGDSAEFSVLIGGAVRFSRAADFPAPVTGDELVSAVITETRRTWMSYRIVEAAEEVRRVVVMGPLEAAEAIAGRVAEMLHVPAEVLRFHPLVHDDGVSPADAWPLAGLLLESVRGQPSIDFARPRRPPDIAAKRRRAVLAIAGAAVIAFGAVGTAGMVHLHRLEQRSELAAQQANGLIGERARMKRDALRLEHLQRWQNVRVDWLGHLQRLADLQPAPEALVLDKWTGDLEFRGVRYDDGWAAPHAIQIAVEGEARDRSIADAFRAALVRSETYVVKSAGPDGAPGRRLPYGFTYTLRGDGELPGAPADTTEPGAEDAP